MRRFQCALLAAVAIIGFTSIASAADMPVKAAPMVAPAYNWTGFYIGIEGGYGWGSTSHTNVVTGIGSVTDHSLKGGIFGATYGYNWQTGPWVLGLEGDFSWSGIKDAFIDPSGFCGAGPNCNTNLRWLGTDRVRLGYAWDRYLVYGTGGVAYGSVNAGINNACCDFETHTRVGYTVGGGIEAMLVRNWSAKLEYLYVNLGDKVNYNATIVAPPDGESVAVRFNMVRVGLNYKFGP
jgi:outer membrane immunogenic protein